MPDRNARPSRPEANRHGTAAGPVLLILNASPPHAFQNVSIVQRPLPCHHAHHDLEVPRIVSVEVQQF
jgi:hypothetical protein